MSPGLDERDTAFMKRLRNLAQEALTWPHLGQKQRLVWAAALELDAVPIQEPDGGQVPILIHDVDGVVMGTWRLKTSRSKRCVDNRIC